MSTVSMSRRHTAPPVCPLPHSRSHVSEPPTSSRVPSYERLDGMATSSRTGRTNPGAVCSGRTGRTNPGAT